MAETAQITVNVANIPAVARKLSDYHNALADLLQWADAHRISSPDCTMCGGECYEEWSVLKAEAEAAMEAIPELVSGTEEAPNE